jgi:uncharacterized membrane protein YebE (DUF533 family)
LPFKCNLQRYSVEVAALGEVAAAKADGFVSEDERKTVDG